MISRLNRRTFLAALIALGLASLVPLQARAAAPIPCRPGMTARPRKSIIDFVAAVTKEGGPDYVKPRRAHRHLRQ